MNDMQTETQRTYRRRILGVLVHIQQNLDDDLSLDELARIAHFSRFHFHRIFRSLVGESVKEHVRRLRLERAALQLTYGPDSVLNVALDAGYDAHESFTRAFRSMFDCSPSEYRQMRREKFFADSASRVHYSPCQELDDNLLLTPGEMKMEVRIESFPETNVVFARGVGSYKTSAQIAWEKLCAWAGPNRIFGPDAMMIGICHDDPEVTPEDKIRYDAAITIRREVKPEGDIGLQTIPAGNYAVTTHRGPYDNLHEKWSALCGQWIPQNGRQFRIAPSFEIYRNDPQNTPPDELITDLYAPIE